MVEIDNGGREDGVEFLWVKQKVEVRDGRNIEGMDIKERTIIDVFGGYENVITNSSDALNVYNLDSDMVSMESNIKLKINYDIIPPKDGVRIIYNVYENWLSGVSTSELDEQRSYIVGILEEVYPDKEVVEKGCNVYKEMPEIEMDPTTVDYIDGV